MFATHVFGSTRHVLRRFSTLTALLVPLAASGILGGARPAHATGDYNLQYHFGAVKPQQTIAPTCVAYDAKGNLYVGEVGRIAKFNAARQYVSQFFLRDSDSGIALQPVDLAIDKAGNIFVIAAANAFTPDVQIGSFVYKFKQDGTLSARFNKVTATSNLFQPTGIALDPDGKVYIADQKNSDAAGLQYASRIVKYANDGTFIAQFSQYEQGEGYGLAPRDVAIDPRNGNIITTGHTGPILVLDSNGNLLRSFGNPGNGNFAIFDDLTVDTAGNVYGLDSFDQNIRKYDGNGTLLATTPIQGDSAAIQYLHRGMAISPDNTNLVVSDENYYAIQNYGTATLNYTRDFPAYGEGLDQWARGTRLAIDSANHLYRVDTYNNRVVETNRIGQVIRQIGSTGSSAGHFNQPQGAITDTSDNLYVLDTGNFRVQEFDASGQFVRTFGTQGSGDGQFYYPMSICRDATNNLYVADKIASGGNCLEKFSANGAFLGRILLSGDQTGSSYVASAAVKQDGTLLVSYGITVNHYNSSGAFLSTIASSAYGLGYFKLDSEENLVFSSSTSPFVNKYAPDGTFLETIGNGTNGKPIIGNVADVAVGTNGALYILDTNKGDVSVWADRSLQPVAVAAGPDNTSRVLWNRGDGYYTLWRVDNTTGTITLNRSYPLTAGYTPISLAVGPDNTTYLLSVSSDGGTIGMTFFTPDQQYGGTQQFFTPTGAGWKPESLAIGSDNKPRILWRRYSDNTAALWRLGGFVIENAATFGPYTDLEPIGIAAGSADGKTRLLWKNQRNGQATVWTLNTAESAPESGKTYNAPANYTLGGLTLGGADNKPRLVWERPFDGAIALWRLSPDTTILESGIIAGPFAGLLPVTNGAASFPVSSSGDGKARLLWSDPDGRAILRTLTPAGTGTETSFTFGPY